MSLPLVAGKPFTITDPTPGVCPCGRRIVAGYVEGAPCVLHEEPACRDYESREPDKYLWWVNEVQGRHGPEA